MTVASIHPEGVFFYYKVPLFFFFVFFSDLGKLENKTTKKQTWLGFTSILFHLTLNLSRQKIILCRTVM